MRYYIYTIKDNEDESQFYIGSTVNFSRRKSHHKKNVTNRRGKLYWCKLYFYIRHKKGWENFTMEIIEDGETDLKSTILQKEQEYINQRNPPLNMGTASTLFKAKPT
jgi:predicted GIY-YIG superfamily endonuclease